MHIFLAIGRRLLTRVNGLAAPRTPETLFFGSAAPAPKEEWGPTVP